MKAMAQNKKSQYHSYLVTSLLGYNSAEFIMIVKSLYNVGPKIHKSLF